LINCGYYVIIRKRKEVINMINDLSTLVSTLGFPIGMCLIMCYYINKINDAHKEESNKFAEALNNNTLVLQKLCDKLDSEVNVNDK
jgi:hypothetical protein